ncbi:MAG: hypothetical protein QOG77_846, partial [Solirubrobacteraceae bacterium]|nr:hypothetical protein [Solirubrobacteraceae bacterium]
CHVHAGKPTTLVGIQAPWYASRGIGVHRRMVTLQIGARKSEPARLSSIGWLRPLSMTSARSSTS